MSDLVDILAMCAMGAMVVADWLAPPDDSWLLSVLMLGVLMIVVLSVGR